jgi:hypothetical protein
LESEREFLFYTEYNLKESAGKKSSGVEIFTDTRDTPDVLIEVLKPKIFIVIEAKMFLNINQDTLNIQMQLQRKAIIEKLENHYQPCLSYHIALVPQQLGFKSTPDYTVIEWQFFTERMPDELSDNYFFNYLKFALENYAKSVSNKSRIASTIQGREKGLTIYMDGKTQQRLRVGRVYAKKAIEEDVFSGIWTNKQYGINAEKPVDGREGNWINSAEFAAIVDSRK